MNPDQTQHYYNNIKTFDVYRPGMLSSVEHSIKSLGVSRFMQPMASQWRHHSEHLSTNGAPSSRLSSLEDRRGVPNVASQTWGSGWYLTIKAFVQLWRIDHSISFKTQVTCRA